jgi:hypothetical protein
MSDEDKSGEAVIGCATSAWALLVTLPLWFAILFGILQHINTPMWLWVCFWVYVPANVLCAIATAILKQMLSRT